jgi:hypothetical protein
MKECGVNINHLAGSDSLVDGRTLITMIHRLVTATSRQLRPLPPTT